MCLCCGGYLFKQYSVYCISLQFIHTLSMFQGAPTLYYVKFEPLIFLANDSPKNFHSLSSILLSLTTDLFERFISRFSASNKVHDLAELIAAVSVGVMKFYLRCGEPLE